jgi:prepilin-type N-terminal cleavage/methylation domain-containing protein
VATTVRYRKTGLIERRKSEAGFSLIEVMVSMAVLTIGLLSLLGVFGLAMAATQDSQQDLIAKQLANEALESIITARDTAQIQWDQVRNISDGGIFLNDYQEMYKPGADGIMGTADDVAGGQYIQLTEPGSDGVYGTSDDTIVPLSNYQRKVEIQPVVDAGGNVVSSLRSVNITIRYNTPRSPTPKTYVLTTFISQFR